MKTLCFENIPKRACGFGIIETVLTNETFTEPHAHDFCEMFYMKDGIVVHQKNDVAYTMQKGDYCFMHASDVHCFKKGVPAAAHLVNISFPTQVLEEMLSNTCTSLTSNDAGHLTSTQQKLLEETVQLLCKQSFCPEAIEQQQLLIKNLLQTILLTHTLTDTTVRPHAPQWLQNGIDALQTPEILAQGMPAFIRICGHTQEHITRQAKKYYQQTPSQIINAARVERAQHLLATTDDSILHISLQLGYESVSYFNRVFLRQVGVTPRQYRNQLKSILY